MAPRFQPERTMTEPAPRVLYLVDGTYTVFRSYFAIQRLSAPDGTPTNGVFGFLATLRKLVRDRKPHYFGVAFDLEGKTHRDEVYADYKAQRPPAPDDLVPQFALAMEACEVLRWPVLCAEGFEADDVLATLSRLGREQGLEIVIVTSDKDLYQLVEPGVTVLNPSKDDRMLDPAGVLEVFGAPPQQVRDVLALMGDAVDNVPGVPGIGEKTAKALVLRYGSLESLLARAKLFAILWRAKEQLAVDPTQLPSIAAEVSKPAAELAALERRLGGDDGELLAAKFESLAALRADDAKAASKLFKGLESKTQPKIWLALEENEAVARLSLDLVTVRTDAPVALDLNALIVEEPDVPRAIELFTRLGFRGLTQEMAQASTDLERAADALQIEVICDAIALEAQLASLRSGGMFAIDTETDGLVARRANLVGVSLAAADDRGAYLPVGHRTADPQLPWSEAAARLKPLLEDPNVPKCGQNMKYDRAALRRAGIRLNGLAFDTLIAAQLLDPGRSTSHKLDDLALSWLNERMIPYSEVAATADGEVTLDHVPVSKVAPYAVEDAVVAWRLVDPLRDALRKQDLLELFETIEMPIVPILEEMEHWGIGIDVAALSAISQRMATELKQLESEIFSLAGRPFTINSPQQLRVVLFEELGLKPAGRRTQKTREHSTGQESLEALASAHPLPAKVLEYREITKLKSTYVDALPKLVDPEDGRVHGSFHQLGAATGRLSSSDPNLQNIPVRSALGRSIRACFVPQPGWRFVAADYSQMELRILAHLSDDPALIEAFERDVDIHAYTASLVDGVPLELVTPQARARAKAVNFGIVYGMSEFRLAREQGMSRDAARQFIESYFKRYPRVREYIDGSIAAVQRTGETRTLYGRVRKFQELMAADGDVEGPSRPERDALLRQAVNATVQGTAADIAKRAMIALCRRFEAEQSPARLLLQVHDELLIECPESDTEAASAVVREAMEGAARLSVPLKVDVRVTSAWEK